MRRVLALAVGVFLFVAPAHAQVRRVAVLDFANTTKDSAVEWLGPAVAETITTKLNALRSLQLVERAQLYKVLQEQRLNLSDLVDPSQAIQVGKLLGAEQVVLGGYAAFGGTVRFTARFVDTATGVIVATSQVNGLIDPKNPNGLWMAFDHLAQAAIDSLNTRVTIVQGLPQPVPVAPDRRIEPTPAERAKVATAPMSSLEAQEAYGRALVAFRKNILVDAAREFERATALEPDYAKAWQDLGRVREFLGRWPEALMAQETAYQLLVRAGDETAQAISLRWIGHVHLRQGRYPEALNYYERGVRLAQKLGDESLLAAALGSVGIVHERQGRFAEALRYHEQALRLVEKVKDEPAQVNALGNIGVVHARQNRYAEALPYLERSLRLAETLGDETAQAMAVLNIGAIHAGQNRYAQALTYYERSLRLAEKLGAEPQQAWSLFSIGLVHEGRNRYAEALSYYERAAVIADRLGMAERDQILEARNRARRSAK